MRIHPAVTMMFLLSGCSLIPAYERPRTDVPSVWKEGSGTPSEAPATPFVARFENEELDRLVARAMQENLDLRAALHRVEQARAATRVAGSALWPSAGLSAGAGRDVARPANGSTRWSSSGSVGADVAYAVDLFGRNRAGLESAELQEEATQYDREALALIVSADVARTYAAALALEDRLEVAQENLANSRDILRIVEARFHEGAASGLEVAQQRAAQAGTEASVAELERQRSATRHALAVLLGQTPQSLQLSGTGLEQLTLPAVSAGQPSELLERRPDIKRAEAVLKAANADIGAARAAFFPSLTIGLDAALSATPITGPASMLAGVGASLAQTIFSGGALTGQLEGTTARRNELIETYRKTVLVSFQEVEDALAAVKSAQTRETALTSAEREAREAYRISRERFDAGAIDFITLLDAQRSLLQAQDTLVQARLERLTAATDLYLALGGKWQ